MHKSATKCNETIGKWCNNKHGASKIIDMFETYHPPVSMTGAAHLIVLYYIVSHLEDVRELEQHFIWSNTRPSMPSHGQARSRPVHPSSGATLPP
jgi:hypothetical protein